MNTTLKRAVSITTLILGLFVFVPQATSSAATKLNLGAAGGFGVISNTSVTNTGATTVSGTAGGLVGVSPGSSITGFPPGITSSGLTTGLIAPGPQGILDAQAAFTSGNGQLATPISATLSGSLTPGVYSTGAADLATGITLTLNGGNDPNAVFIIQTSSSLVTGTSSAIALTNGAQACNVFWLVGTSATLGVTSTFVGHIIAQSAIVANTSASIDGSLMALTAGITLAGNAITNNNCASVVAPPEPLQTSRIDSVTPATCVTSGPTTVTINGSFPAQITNVTVNGATASQGSWVQSLTSVVVTTSVSTTSPVLIQIYNGTMPLLAPQTFTCTAVPVVVVPPIVVPPVPPVVTGTIHVVKIVNNTYGGAATAGDFTLWLRNHGTDVLGSPATGVSGVGRTYILAPGTYVLGEVPSDAFPNYISNFKIIGGTTPNIVLHAGEDLTVVQTNNELPPLVSPVPVITPPATETGGQLPKTSSPWFNLLMIGIGFMAIGGIVLGLKRSPKI